jgi:hypothetical protein
VHLGRFGQGAIDQQARDPRVNAGSHKQLGC